MAAGSASPAVTIRSEKIPDPGPLHDLLPEPPAFAWLRGGEGLVGWGEAARIDLTGPGRLADADRWWQDYVRGVAVDDEVGLPGSGPVAVVSFGFADGPTPSALIVPRVVVGRRGGITWRTTVGPDHGAGAGSVTARRAPVGVRLADDTAAVDRWRNAVADAVRAIRTGDLAKVVLALSVEATAAEPLDSRELLARLLGRYPDCWGFLVDGLVGATPELLVERTGLEVRSRVLAGTLPRADHDSVETGGLDDSGVVATGAALLASGKDLSEHRIAVVPVVDVLSELLDGVRVPAGPAVLELANVVHLATEVTGRLRDDRSVLELAAALHPTPAVAGTPVEPSLRLIDDLEADDRGRYAGPVGWTDARGDGELCLALRCAAVRGTTIRLYAGCGIVADSDPDAEVAEWRAKLRPVLDALYG
jgi:menaquinone-specific isochorismate synthase